MSFIDSAINQIGRDLGRVVSNKIFKDAHATPHRIVGTHSRRVSRSTPKETKSEFESAINFQTSYKGDALIRKLVGAYSIIKNETNNFLADGYLDENESRELFSMMKLFSDKTEDINEILNLDQEANAKQIEQLHEIFYKLSDLFRESLEIASIGCVESKGRWEIIAEGVEKITFTKFVALNGIFMRNYALTGERKTGAIICANIASMFMLFIPNLLMLVYGALSFNQYKNEAEESISYFYTLAKGEDERAVLYRKLALKQPKRPIE